MDIFVQASSPRPLSALLARCGSFAQVSARSNRREKAFTFYRIKRERVRRRMDHAVWRDPSSIVWWSGGWFLANRSRISIFSSVASNYIDLNAHGRSDDHAFADHYVVAPTITNALPPRQTRLYSRQRLLSRLSSKRYSKALSRRIPNASFRSASPTRNCANFSLLKRRLCFKPCPLFVRRLYLCRDDL